jgi:hypothetical protein
LLSLKVKYILGYECKNNRNYSEKRFKCLHTRTFVLNQSQAQDYSLSVLQLSSTQYAD